MLTVNNLSVSFDGEPALRPVSFSLEARDSLAIIGPNGAGKSLLIKALMGIVPYTGTIEWAKGVHIGYVPQKIDADRHLPINLRNLLTAKAAVLHASDADIQAIAKTVGITEKILDPPIGHLSGGQFQRSLIAFALLGKPNVLILDEPTASIDKPGEEQVYELIHRLKDTYGMTVILVSHDLNFVHRYATKVLCLNQNGALCFGAPDEALTPDVLEQLYGPHEFFHRFHHPEDKNQKHA
jgi:zinc transport system ATP-binding protein